MGNRFSKNISKIAGVFVVLFFCLFLHLTYIQIFDDHLKHHILNKVSRGQEETFERGAILDYSGQKLAYSKKNADGTFYRYYPYGEIFAQSVGYASSNLGEAGAEKTFSADLSGKSNRKYALGAISQLLNHNKGNDVILTLHTKIQEFSYRLLQGRKGAVVLLDPSTGAILAMVSSPAFSPNEIEKNWNAILQDDHAPLLNRACQGLYPPGSIIKPLLADEALKKNNESRKDQMYCSGKYYLDHQDVLGESNNVSHGDVDMKQALTISCNVYFAALANHLGASAIHESYERFGFYEPLPGLEAVAENLPDFSSLNAVELAQIAIGQGKLLVTPLRMALLASAFANKGVIMEPHLMKEIKMPNGDIIEKYREKILVNATNTATADFIRSCMENVVNEGTGQLAWNSSVKIAGKTGTAENEDKISHAWFIGFAPADHPAFAIAVIVENAGSGGNIAAPIAKEILTYAFHEEVEQ